jgi:serine/threonine protein kinase
MKTEQHLLALQAGHLLGKYRFEAVLGSGGFGITYLAEDTSLERKVAIKELLPNDFATRLDGTTVVAKTQSDKDSLEWARTRFLEEGRVLAACSHPNVVDVYEMLEANGTAYMVTKYEEGQDLEHWLRQLGRPPSQDELRGILLPLLSGLERVHQTGFLHRDIKPENIYLTTDGRPVLLDFGSARQSISSRSRMLTAIITPGYAPFEQYHEAGNQGPWSDTYALGAVMYRSITGNRPPEAAARLMGNDPCETLAPNYADRYDVEFLQAVDRALSVKESDRPQNVEQWRKMLDSNSVPQLASEPKVSRAKPPEINQVTAPKVDQMTPPEVSQVGPGKVDYLKIVSQYAHQYPARIAGSAAALVGIGIAIWFVAAPKPAPNNQHNDLVVNDGNGQNHLSEVKPIDTNPTPDQRPTIGVNKPIVEQIPTPTPAPTQPLDTVHLGPVAKVQPTPTPPIDTSLITPVPNPNPSPVVASVVDPRLVGAWEGKHKGTGWTEKWDLKADGSYSLSGTVNAEGTYTAGAGKISEYFPSTQQSIELIYQLDVSGNNFTLTTTAPDGTVTVWRPTKTDVASQPSGSNQERPRQHHNRQPSGHPSAGGIIDKVIKHFGF